MIHPLSPYGFDERVAALFTLVPTPGAREGRVVRADRGSCLVALADGIVRADAPSPASRRHGGPAEPVTGDWVAVVGDPATSFAVAAVVPRRSAISRRDPMSTDEQVLAANVDLVGVVCPLDRELTGNRLERFLAAAWESGGRPLVVLTKADVSADAAGEALRAEGLSPGVEVVATSAVTGEGLERLSVLVAPALTLVLLGLSGAGKSTLVNALVGREAQRRGEVRPADRRGRHTTSTRDLVLLPGGGLLLDTPGLRSLTLWSAETGLAAAFPELDDLAASCRFRDCAHDGEPGCALEAGTRDGSLDPRRLESYRKLQREMAALEVQKDERARRAANRRFGRMARQAQRLKYPPRG